jgi:Uma2 family endonuclease
MPVTMKTFERVALEDPEGMWELHRGCLRSKADAMTTEHNRIAYRLFVDLARQLDDARFEIRVNQARARRQDSTSYVPDVLVVERREVEQALAEHPRSLEAYATPLPLVVEIWSPSTGAVDSREKLPEYQRRGDAEIWLIHPRERTLDVWTRQPDGSYAHARHGEAHTVTPAALPGVRIDVGRLFGR